MRVATAAVEVIQEMFDDLNFRYLAYSPAGFWENATDEQKVVQAERSILHLTNWFGTQYSTAEVKA